MIFMVGVWLLAFAMVFLSVHVGMHGAGSDSPCAVCSIAGHTPAIIGTVYCLSHASEQAILEPAVHPTQQRSNGVFLRHTIRPPPTV
jgi:hypothetical protein